MSLMSSEMNFDELLQDIRYLVKKDQKDLISNIITDLHPADVAEIMSHLNDDERRTLFALLSPETASEVLAELEEVVKEDVLEGMDSEQIAELVNEMASDDAADVVSELPEEQASEVLDKVEEERSEDIQELLLYPEDSAGGIMAKEYVAMNANFTVQQAIENIRTEHHDVDDLYYCYIVDDFGTLVGMTSLRSLILAKPNTAIHTLMEEDIVIVESDMDQEEVAQLFRKYDLVSAPVVNKMHKLIGRITIDDIVDVIDEEIEEDLGRIAGTNEEEVLEDSVVQISRARLPWLIISFIGQVFAAFIIKYFEGTFYEIAGSALFIPMAMAMGGSVGQQSSIIVVRGLASGEIAVRDTLIRLKREFFVSVLNGTVLSVLIFLLIIIWIQNLRFGIVLSTSLIAIIINASIFGAVIPIFFKQLNVDPALATGPFVAAFNDVVGLIIYFGLITIGFSYFV
jgi:magnesium transporter